jgi:hypothetical protein
MENRLKQLGVLLMLLWFCRAQAAVFYVDVNSANPTPPFASWSTAATDIQSAVDAANPGDLVLVTNGVYQTGGHVVLGDSMNRVAITKPLTVLSVNGPGATTILGDVYPHYEYGTRCAYVTNGATLAGFTLSSGRVGFGTDYHDFDGGGIYAESGGVVSNCVVSGNSVYTSGSGGGAYAGTLINCSLTGNSVPEVANVTPIGGGACFSTLVNCAVFGNSSGGYGGGANQCTLDNCTVANNYASAGGGVSFCTINNSIVYFNSNNPNYGSSPNYSGSGFAYCCTTPDPGGTGNILSDPGFVDAATNNFNLQPASPCINSGNNTYVSATTDLAGCPRIVDGIVDMGAYEYQPPALAIVTQPASQTNLIGQTGVLNVVAESPYQQNIYYQWQFDSNNIVGATNASLVLTNLQTTNAGNYEVVVSGVSSNSVVLLTSSNAVLSVFYPPPAIVQQPTNSVVILGSNSMVSVTATSYLNMSFQWQLNGTNLTDGGEFSGTTNSALFISGARIADGGNYQVIVSDSEWTVTSAVATITVLLPATITVQPTNETVIIANNALFSGTAGGTGTLGYRWCFNGLPLSDGGRISGSASASLNISSVQLSDGGQYQLVVTNSFSSTASAVATLTVLAPVQIVNQPVSQAVLLSSNANFFVNVTGTGLSYQWYFNGYPMTDGMRISGSSSPSLNISNIQSNDAGSYQVVVSNVLNVASSMSVTLTPLATLSSSIRYVNLSNPSPASPFLAWDTAATNIQDAIDASVNGDQILVTNGTYQAGGRVVYGALTNRVVVNKAVTVQSVNGPAVTTIQGYWTPGTTNSDNSVRCVYMTNNTALIGFTLTNGATRHFGDGIEEQSGGGVWCESTNNTVISNCVIVANAAWNQGGGVYRGTLLNCTIANNSGASGGGAASALLANCALFGNSSTTGGGAYLGILDNCLITSNAATGSLGAGGGAANAEVLNSAIAGNSAGKQGGGAYAGVLVNCTVTGNSATNGAGTAGSVQTNCIVFYNTYNGFTNVNNWLGGSFNFCCTRPLPFGTGNFTNDPALASISHLSLNSPCRGMGNATATSGTDIDGEPWANPPSIGCDELYPGNVVGNISLSLSTAYTNLAPGYAGAFLVNISGPVNASKIDFGDSTVVSNSPYASHTWSSVGVYPVVLTAYNDTFPTGQTTTLIIHIVVPAVYYVDLNSVNPVAPYSYWSTAATTIQDAVNAAVPGSLVLVTNNYSITRNMDANTSFTNYVAAYHAGGQIVYGSLSNRVAITKRITVQSVNGPQYTWIQGVGYNQGNQVRGVYMTNGVILSGFTITNGCADESGNQTELSSGGGIWSESTNDVITNCIITGCFAGYAGGGAYSGSLYNCIILNNPPPSSPAQYGGGAYASILEHCTLNGNVSEYGGGAANCIANDCLFTNNGSLNNNVNGGGAYMCVASNCSFYGNVALYGGGASGGTLSSCTLAGNYGMYGGGAACSAGTSPIVLTNCLVTGNVASFSGGGIYSLGAYNSNNCVANNCILSFNVATNYGGGAAFATMNNCLISSNVVPPNGKRGGGAEGGMLSNCTLTGNRASEGGGADCNGFGTSAGGILSNCMLSNNIAFNGPGGAADFVTLNNCTLVGNVATNLYGGGASFSTLVNCLVIGNTVWSSQQSGGGGAAYSALYGCFLTSNSAPRLATGSFRYGMGGASYQCTLTNCVLSYNSAGTNGGGDYASTLVNCTVVGNSAPLGGGVYNSTVINSIIYHNTDNAGGNYCQDQFGHLFLKYCCTTPPTNGAGNITNEPAFINLPGGDFHLQSSSPCINSGDNAFVTMTNDLDSNPRIEGGTVDIGAYEYQTPASILSYAWAQQYGLPVDGSADFLDLDGTGMKNWQKSIAGLNPTNPASVLAMLPLVTTNTAGVTISWESVNTRAYYLQRATNLAALPVFSIIESNLIGQPVVTSFTDTSAMNGGPYFYRVGVQ